MNIYEVMCVALLLEFSVDISVSQQLQPDAMLRDEVYPMQLVKEAERLARFQPLKLPPSFL